MLTSDYVMAWVRELETRATAAEKALADAVAAEREACAKECDDTASRYAFEHREAAQIAAQRIRTRAPKPAEEAKQTSETALPAEHSASNARNVRHVRVGNGDDATPASAPEEPAPSPVCPWCMGKGAYWEHVRCLRLDCLDCGGVGRVPEAKPWADIRLRAPKPVWDENRGVADDKQGGATAETGGSSDPVCPRCGGSGLLRGDTSSGPWEAYCLHCHGTGRVPEAKGYSYWTDGFGKPLVKPAEPPIDVQPFVDLAVAIVDICFKRGSTATLYELLRQCERINLPEEVRAAFDATTKSAERARAEKPGVTGQTISLSDAQNEALKLSPEAVNGFRDLKPEKPAESTSLEDATQAMLDSANMTLGIREHAAELVKLGRRDDSVGHWTATCYGVINIGLRTSDRTVALDLVSRLNHGFTALVKAAQERAYAACEIACDDEMEASQLRRDQDPGDDDHDEHIRLAGERTGIRLTRHRIRALSKDGGK